MPYDAGVAAAVRFELAGKLAGGRIEKVVCPARDRIVLQIYSKGEKHSLCLDMDASLPKVYITNQAEENLASVPQFCLILRKYLINAKISAVSLLGFDRVFEFFIDATDDMGFSRPLCLYAECIRKQSNLILCGIEQGESEQTENKKIISALKSVDFSMSSLRQILNGLTYEPPLLSDKTNPLCETRESFLNGLEEAAKESPELFVCDWMLSRYQGLSPLVTRELAYRAAGDASVSMGAVGKANLCRCFFELWDNIKSEKFCPTMLKDEKNALVDFSYLEISQYGAKAESTGYEFMSELLDDYFLAKDRDNRIRQKAQDIFKILANATSRLAKKLQKIETGLAECQEREEFRIYGDLITANIYRLEKGADKYAAQNFYDQDKPVEISVDKRLTPAQNAQKFYKKYNKLKSAEYHLEEQARLTKDDMSYIESVAQSLSGELSERELAEVRDELAGCGFMKAAKPGKTEKSDKTAKTQKSGARSKKPQKRLPVSKPAEYSSKNGFRILCGKNNRQNDELSFSIADKNDLWFHAQKLPGSHVILVCGNVGRSPEPGDIEDAAKIAAANSKGSELPLVGVDYAPVRYVKKPNGAKPGFVTYTNFKTVTVSPR
ncbi:MAG: NFACT family protein [Oscillospiraceae bacterium]|nr:NFACT family protein [Oscillospiraceae bacterium]